jgi:hypothetical protein
MSTTIMGYSGLPFLCSPRDLPVLVIQHDFIHLCLHTTMMVCIPSTMMRVLIIYPPSWILIFLLCLRLLMMFP